MEKKKPTMMGIDKKKITGKDLGSFIANNDAKSVLRSMEKKDWQTITKTETDKKESVCDEMRPITEKQDLHTNSNTSDTAMVTDDMKEQICEENERPVSLSEQVEMLTSPKAVAFLVTETLKVIIVGFVIFLLGGCFFMSKGSGGAVFGLLIWGAGLVGFIVYSKNNREKNLKKGREILKKSREGR